MRSNSLRKLGAEWANGRDAHKKLRGCTASLSLLFLVFPFSFLFFLYFHIFFRSLLRYLRERLSSLAGPGGARPPNHAHLVNFGSAFGEDNFSDDHIIHLFTIRLLTAQNHAPAGGRPVWRHDIAPPPLVPPLCTVQFSRPFLCQIVFVFYSFSFSILIAIVLVHDTWKLFRTYRALPSSPSTYPPTCSFHFAASSSM